ncbi:MAG: exodeoxyribonuclease V subunit alpha [Verrucomicrobia bacterium]|nr:exodeoxyribonuclease V subunit alpha [Verrucomicrobiota bacterium]
MPVVAKSLEPEQHSPFSPLDMHFAGLMEKFAGAKNERIHLAAALVSYFRGRGHICLDLSAFCKIPFLPDSSERVSCPPLKPWLVELRKSKVVGKPGDFCPLILDDHNRLYLHRYWKYEHDLAETIRRRIGHVPADETILANGLQRLFTETENPNWQKIAAFGALTRRFTVVSGGPGTGKTTAVLKILALLLEQGKTLRIALTAPTGKAASRLQDTIKTAKPKLDCTQEVKGAIPETASTIHRLLGVIPDSPFFRHNAKNQLPVDVVVIDEASMVDLALMTKLLAAIPESARVILLGDKDQLSSVEAGAVLGDICSSSSQSKFSETFCNDYARITSEKMPAQFCGAKNPMNDCIVQLQKNYRFGDDSPIYRMSAAVRTGDFVGLKDLLATKSVELEWQPTARLNEGFKQLVIDGFEKFLTAGTPVEALQLLNHFRVLAAVRDSEFGVVELNRRIERILREQGLIKHSHPLYEGRPVMVTRNDYTLNLFNGDTGILRHDEETGQSRAFFLTADNQLRKVLPARLPEHETVFAMTIHKSQGSEFDHVLIILPENESPMLTQELLYTGITRARKSVSLFASERVLRLAVSRRVERSSGLESQLWG